MSPSPLLFHRGGPEVGEKDEHHEAGLLAAILSADVEILKYLIGDVLDEIGDPVYLALF
jgi:hypothetical protein